MLSGRFMLTRLLHRLKALFPMRVIPSGNVTLVSLSLNWNKKSPTPVTLFPAIVAGSTTFSSFPRYPVMVIVSSSLFTLYRQSPSDRLSAACASIPYNGMLAIITININNPVNNLFVFIILFFLQSFFCKFFLSLFRLKYDKANYNCHALFP